MIAITRIKRIIIQETRMIDIQIFLIIINKIITKNIPIIIIVLIDKTMKIRNLKDLISIEIERIITMTTITLSNIKIIDNIII